MAVIINGDTGIDKITDGSVVNADIASGIDAAKLTGTLPAIDGSALTGISSYSDSDALTLFNASGSAPVYACRAWVNFNGTGTVAIRSSGNVSSITDNGTGDYTVNFTTAMPDANYAVSGIPSKDNTTGYLMRSINVIDNFAPTTSYCRVCVDYAGNTSNFDVPYVMLQFFR